MGQSMASKQTLRYRRWTVLILMLILIGSIPLWFHSASDYLSSQTWTGFGPHTIEEKTTSIKTTDTGIETEETKVEKPQRAKTLWEWMQLLVVPGILVGVGGLLNLTLQRIQQNYTKEQSQTERERIEKKSQIEYERISRHERLEREHNRIQAETEREIAAALCDKMNETTLLKKLV
jgi:hypothetical protein